MRMMASAVHREFVNGTREDNPLVSVIVPAYNVEAYLEACLDSILSQDYPAFEIVLVDDGSTDSTGALCDEYARVHPCIRAIHKENGGLSSARNAGIAAARGSYLAFVDSDDLIAPRFISALMHACVASQCDIAALRTVQRFNDGDAPELVEASEQIPSYATEPSEAYLSQILRHQADMGAQFRLYRSEVFAHERFTEGILFEDFDLVYRVLRRVEHVAVVDEPRLYGYRMRTTSIIGSAYAPAKLQSMIGVSERFLGCVCSWWPEVERAAKSYCFTVFRMVFAQIPSGHADENVCWNHLKKFRHFALVDDGSRFADRFTALLAYAGKVPFRLFCTAARRLGIMR